MAKNLLGATHYLTHHKIPNFFITIMTDFKTIFVLLFKMCVLNLIQILE